jgi:hypothetical protein
VLSVAAIGAGFRRFLHLLVVTTAAVVVAAPLLLGPAFGAALRALGTSSVHHCACGMEPGRCGCPECEQAEAERQRDRESPVVVIRSSCDDGVVLPAARALPPSVMTTALALPPQPSPFMLLRRSSGRPPSVSIRPPTPPPRSERTFLT